MSSDEFYGRPITKGFSSLEINLCEVCQRKSPNWMEVNYSTETPVVRFTCDDCHQEAINKEGGISDEFFARELGQEEDLPEPSRPAWVQEIIKEQELTGGIQTIDPTDQTNTSFSAPPESFTEDIESLGENEELVSDRQVASWAPKFIQEALFGPNPEKWLNEQGGFHEDNADLTMKTLASFVDHDMPSVKLSAIQCLSSLSKKNPGKKSEVEKVVALYGNDSDEMVSDFAQQTMNNL